MYLEVGLNLIENGSPTMIPAWITFASKSTFILALLIVLLPIIVFTPTLLPSAIVKVIGTWSTVLYGVKYSIVADKVVVTA